MALPPSNGYTEEHDLDGEIDYSDIEQKCVRLAEKKAALDGSLLLTCFFFASRYAVYEEDP